MAWPARVAGKGNVVLRRSQDKPTGVSRVDKTDAARGKKLQCVVSTARRPPAAMPNALSNLTIAALASSMSAASPNSESCSNRGTDA
jgi:hypothetical protein